MAPDLDLHCLSLVQQFLDASVDRKMDFNQILGQEGKKLRCPDI